MFEVDLPYPPTINSYWRFVNGRMYLTHKARKYRQDVAEAVRKAKGWQAWSSDPENLSDRICLYMVLYPPDNQKRDLDNVLKAVVDALEAAGAFNDDSQVDEMHVYRREQSKNGRLYVRVVAFKEYLAEV